MADIHSCWPSISEDEQSFQACNCRMLAIRYKACQPPLDVLQLAHDDGAEESLFRGEMLVYRAFTDADALGEVIHHQALVALLGEQLRRFAENQLPALRALARPQRRIRRGKVLFRLCWQGVIPYKLLARRRGLDSTVKVYIGGCFPTA